MESTVPTLWKMVYEKECRTIIVLYGLKESTEVRYRFFLRCTCFCFTSNDGQTEKYSLRSSCVLNYFPRYSRVPNNLPLPIINFSNFFQP